MFVFVICAPPVGECDSWNVVLYYMCNARLESVIPEIRFVLYNAGWSVRFPEYGSILYAAGVKRFSEFCNCSLPLSLPLLRRLESAIPRIL